MKIKNVALSLAGLTVVTVGLSRMGVFAADDANKAGNVKMDLTNAIQHIINVKLIGGGTDSAILKNAGSRLLGIQTDNFILSKDEEGKINKISGGTSSNILGGVSNKINGGEASTILGGESNTNNGKYSTILGGKTNTLDGNNSVIVGGTINTLDGNNSVIVGGTNNVVDGDYSAVLGSNAGVKGSNSVALGNNTKVGTDAKKANNSFLWTDGKNRGALEESNVFVVNSDHGMVVNTEAPHSFAQLTIGGSLVVNKGDDVTCDSGHKGVLKIVDGDNGHKCFCSCDGVEVNGKGYWHSLYGQGRCEGKCNGDNEKKAGCGEKYAICGNPTDGYRFVGSCNGDSKPVTGEGAYFVDYQGKVHWTCQTDAGMTVRDPNNSNILVQCEADISKKENNSPLCNS